MAALCAVGLSAGAAEHDLQVLKDGVSAASGFSWSGDVLTIEDAGLTVSGSTLKERVVVNAAGVTFKDLVITSTAIGASCVTVNADAALTIAGDNSFSSGDSAVCVSAGEKSLALEGDGRISLACATVGSDIQCGTLGIGGAVNLKATSASAEYAAVSAKGDVNITTDGRVEIRGGLPSLGTQAGSITITGSGDILVETSSGNSIGGNQVKDIVIGGEVNLTVSNSCKDVAAVAATNSITIATSGRVDIQSPFGSGVACEFGGVSISGSGNVVINIGEGGLYGVYAKSGGFSVTGKVNLAITNLSSTVAAVVVQAGGVRIATDGRVEINSAENIDIFCHKGDVVMTGSGIVTLVSSVFSIMANDGGIKVSGSPTILIEGGINSSADVIIDEAADIMLTNCAVIAKNDIQIRGSVNFKASSESLSGLMGDGICIGGSANVMVSNMAMAGSGSGFCIAETANFTATNASVMGSVIEIGTSGRVAVNGCGGEAVFMASDYGDIMIAGSGTVEVESETEGALAFYAEGGDVIIGGDSDEDTVSVTATVAGPALYAGGASIRTRGRVVLESTAYPAVICEEVLIIGETAADVVIRGCGDAETMEGGALRFSSEEAMDLMDDSWFVLGSTEIDAPTALISNKVMIAAMPPENEAYTGYIDGKPAKAVTFGPAPVFVRIPAAKTGYTYVVSNATSGIELEGALADGVNTYRAGKFDTVEVYFTADPGYRFSGDLTNPLKLESIDFDVTVDEKQMPTAEPVPTLVAQFVKGGEVIAEFATADEAVAALDDAQYKDIEEFRIGLAVDTVFDFGGRTNRVVILNVGAGTNTLKNVLLDGTGYAVTGMVGRVVFGDGVRIEKADLDFMKGGFGFDLIIKGGLYKNEPRGYCEDGYLSALRYDENEHLNGLYAVLPAAEIAVEDRKDFSSTRYATLQDAFNLIGENKDVTLRLFNNLKLGTAVAKLEGNKSIHLLPGEAGTNTITRVGPGPVIEIGRGATLEISNVVFDGANVTSEKPMIEVAGKTGTNFGWLIAGNGFVVSNAVGGAVHVGNGGKFELNGVAKIIDNTTGGKPKNVIIEDSNAILLTASGAVTDGNYAQIGVSSDTDKFMIPGGQFGEVNLSYEYARSFSDGDISVTKPWVGFINDRDGTLHHAAGAKIAAAPTTAKKTYKRWVGGEYKVTLEEGDFLISREKSIVSERPELIWTARQDAPAAQPAPAVLDWTDTTLTLAVSNGCDYALVTSGSAETNWVSMVKTDNTYAFARPAGTDYLCLRRYSITPSNIVSAATAYSVRIAAGTKDDPWTVGEGIAAWTNGTEFVVGGTGTVPDLSKLAGKVTAQKLTIEDATVTGAESEAFKGFSNVSLSLPDGWQGELPKDDVWYGATGVTLTGLPLTVRNVRSQQRYPWNGLVDISCDLTGAGTVTLGATVLTNGVEFIEAKTLIGETAIDLGETGCATNGVKFIWNAAKDLPAGFKAKDVQVKVTAEK